MKFLIVDDDPFILKMLTFTLQKSFMDIEVKTAGNGQDAVNILASKEYIPDIILMDYMMPGLDGLEASQKIKKWAFEHDLFIYILMVTAKAQKETEISSLKIVDDYIQKPIDIDILTSRINAAFRITQLINEKNKLLKKNDQLYDHLIETNKMNERLVNRLSEVLEQMAISLSEAIEYKDLTTGYHVLRVGYISEALALGLDLPNENIEMVKYAGFFHDIGKIGIPDQILQKPGKLTDQEFAAIKKHASIGAEIIKPINYFKSIVEGIKYHHERWDGKGYPDGLKEEQIPLVARIISVADVFDVILSPRPYKPSKTEQEALSEIILNRGTQFDPKVVDAFEKLYLEGKIHDIYQHVENKSLPKTNILDFIMSKG
ncbi:MAG TPA: hypothetical protein DHW82_09795 [Spirochaetia bacterium]|nr:MAG: hypothetical protein A2Y41_10285 [Spirochaetes bacterium GWB1_36_13]HCL57284.1 hypothetical protein [Spirochaetia bacterium]